MFVRRNIGSVAQRLMTIVLLAVIGAGPTLATLSVSNRPECTMSCCKRKRDARCCKQHMHSHGVPHHASLLKGVSSCADGCAVALATPATPVLFELGTKVSIVSKAAEEQLIPPPRAPSRVSVFTPFLYQRPPPSFLL